MEREKIHGFPIIAQCDIPHHEGSGYRFGRVVLIDRGVRSPYHDSRYVVASQYSMDDKWDCEWDHGTYYNDYHVAVKGFLEKVEQYVYLRTGIQV